MSSSPPPPPKPRTGKSYSFALFAAALAWTVSSRLLSASSSQGLTNHLRSDWAEPTLAAFFFLFLLAIGYALLNMVAQRRSTWRSVLGLPKRPTALREWSIGLALGWGIVLLTVLPMALTGALRISVWLQPQTFLFLVLSLVNLALLSLSLEIVYRGYLFQRMIEFLGPVAATIGMAFIFALARSFETGASGATALIAFLTGIVFSISWFRTHGLWLAWGMRFGWMASMGVLFGLPVSGSVEHSSIIQTTTYGPFWLTGGEYGPEASSIMFLALLVGLIVLFRVTRTYAWDYTHAPIVPGGYPMDVAPPPEHTAMEQAAQAKASSLVQILPSTPQGRSSGPDHPQS